MDDPGPPSRYTYRCIEHRGCFTVNVPDESLATACEVCGSKSGRDIDKVLHCRLTAAKASTVLAPAVAECPIVYECRIVHSNDLLPGELDQEVLWGAYHAGDSHRVYLGRIMATFADPDAARRLVT